MVFSRPRENNDYAPLAQDDQQTLVDSYSQATLPSNTAALNAHPAARPPVYYNEGRFSPPSSVDSREFEEDKPRDEEELGSLASSGLVVGRKVRSNVMLSKWYHLTRVIYHQTRDGSHL